MIEVMAKAVDNSTKKHLLEKRQEIIWALSLQDYGYADIGSIFNNMNRGSVKRIVDRRPKNYIPKWRKVQE